MVSDEGSKDSDGRLRFKRAPSFITTTAIIVIMSTNIQIIIVIKEFGDRIASDMDEELEQLGDRFAV